MGDLLRYDVGVTGDCGHYWIVDERFTRRVFVGLPYEVWIMVRSLIITRSSTKSTGIALGLRSTCVPNIFI